MSSARLGQQPAGATDGRIPWTVGRLLAATGTLILVGSLVATAAPASAAPGDAHLAGLEYVALGDSYAAGFGLIPPSSFPLAGCAQSSQNYPHLVALELGLALNDVTCSGATTANLTTTPQVVPGGTAAVQDLVLSTSTDIVTVTIGGNDLGFVDIMTFCAALAATGPILGDPATPFTLNNCKEYFVQPAPLGDLLAAAVAGPVLLALNATFADIAAKAPNAKIFVVGYPALTPDLANTPSGVDGCFTTALGSPFPVNSYPYTLVDVPYLYGVETLFDQAVSTAAAAHGATMISMQAQTSAHSPCAIVDPYVNGITLSSVHLAPPPASVTLEPGALHPNAVGAAFQAAQVEAAIRAQFPAPPPPSTEPAGNGLAVTGSAAGGWLALTGLLLLLTGGLTLGAGAVAKARQGRISAGI